MISRWRSLNLRPLRLRRKQFALMKTVVFILSCCWIYRIQFYFNDLVQICFFENSALFAQICIPEENIQTRGPARLQHSAGYSVSTHWSCCCVELIISTLAWRTFSVLSSGCAHYQTHCMGLSKKQNTGGVENLGSNEAIIRGSERVYLQPLNLWITSCLKTN